MMAAESKILQVYTKQCKTVRWLANDVGGKHCRKQSGFLFNEQFHSWQFISQLYRRPHPTNCAIFLRNLNARQ